MKKICAAVITGILMVMMSFRGFTQSNSISTPIISKPYPLQIGYFKTTTLVFPFSIKSVDRGSKDILAQKANNVQNVLLLKAARQGLKETNLTVITADGQLFSFLLNFSENPSLLNFDFSKPTNASTKNVLLINELNEGTLQKKANQATEQAANNTLIKDRKFDMAFSLTGLFVHEQVMYYQIKLVNNSSIDYDIDQLRFFLRDQKKYRRTALQEIEIKPLYIKNEVSRLKGGSGYTVVFALPKMTIPDEKYMAILLMEKNGGRHLQLQLNNRTILKAVPLT